jgi:chromosome segregation ATPase
LKDEIKTRKKAGGKMISISVPASFEYNTGKASHLAARLKSISRIEDIFGWTHQAKTQVSDLKRIMESIEKKQQAVSQALVRKQQEQIAENIFARLFSGRKEHKRMLIEQTRLERERSQIEKLINQFQSALEILPGSQNKARELLREYKRQKSELDSEMKELKAQRTSIRVKARLERANTNYGKYGKGNRQLIRLSKKSAFKSQADEKAALERQLAELKLRITWLERFD